jgi:UDP-glucose 4-epimerase
MDETIFITGATGFIGQRLLNRVKDQSKRIKILSRSPHPEYEVVVCDLASDPVPEDVFDGVGTVFYLAGLAHDLCDASMVEHLYRALNVDASVRLAELAVASGVKHFVFVSSVKAATSDGVYGQTKREAELRLLEIGRQSELHVSILRPSLVYGAGAKGNLALIRKGIEQGWFPPLPETGNRRSMIHVVDLVEALLLVAKDRRANGGIFTATDGTTHSSREIYEAICRAVGKPIPQWNVPKFMFDWIAMLSPRIRYKVDKLLEDEYYSSEKLEALGFKAEKSLNDIDA